MHVLLLLQLLLHYLLLVLYLVLEGDRYSRLRQASYLGIGTPRTLRPRRAGVRGLTFVLAFPRAPQGILGDPARRLLRLHICMLCLHPCKLV